MHNAKINCRMSSNNTKKKKKMVMKKRQEQRQHQTLGPKQKAFYVSHTHCCQTRRTQLTMTKSVLRRQRVGKQTVTISQPPSPLSPDHDDDDDDDGGQNKQRGSCKVKAGRCCAAKGASAVLARLMPGCCLFLNLLPLSVWHAMLTPSDHAQLTFHPCARRPTLEPAIRLNRSEGNSHWQPPLHPIFPFHSSARSG